MELDRIEQVALAAAHSGGEILRTFYGKLDDVKKKGPVDLVTEADVRSEEAIIQTIGSVFPDHGILAEEGGRYQGEGAFTWVIDPLDGTTNFAHGIPMVAVSIACCCDGQPVVAAVLNPIVGELFTATRSSGAWLNGRPISVSTAAKLDDSLLVTGFPYNFREISDPLIRRFRTLMLACRGVRRLGAAAIDLCYVATGRFDGFWEQNLKPWDTAAGLLIVQEAGGRVTNFANEAFTIDSDQILASNGRIHNQMLAKIQLKETE